MRAAIISDLHMGPAGFHEGIQRKLNQYSEPFASEFIKKLNSGNYDFAIQLGDLIEDADEETDRRNLQRVLEILRSSRVPLYHVAGNHDTGHTAAPELAKILGVPSLYYSFRAGGIRCIVLHSVLAFPGEARTIIPPEQLAWLQAELQAASSPVIVFVHHSLADQELEGNPWFEGHPEGALIENRQEVRTMLATSGKVAAVINGHVHWNRIDQHDDIPYITIQSAIENFRNDGTPSHCWGEISLNEDLLQIEVFGSDPMSFRHQASPFACNMNAIDPENRDRHISTTIEVFQAVHTIHEISNGYAFRLPNDTALLMKTAEFIANERLCCPFFGFTLEVEPEGGAVWLQLTGREGVKPFIQAEIGSALNDAVAQAANFR